MSRRTFPQRIGLEISSTSGTDKLNAYWKVVGLFDKRIGRLWQDNGSVHQAIAVDPFSIANLFVNYTVGGITHLTGSRLRFAVNNLTDSHAITGVSAASTASNAPSPNDVLTLMSGRSVSVSLTVGYSGANT